MIVGYQTCGNSMVITYKRNGKYMAIVGVYDNEGICFKMTDDLQAISEFGDLHPEFKLKIF